MKLNKKMAASLLTLAMLAQLGLASYAEDEDGPLTSDSPMVWGLLSFPLRVVTGVAGLGVGALVGGVEGIIDTEKKFAENTFGEAEENPLLVPVGIVGTAVAIPVGFLSGFPEQAVKSGQDGFEWWNRF